MFPCRLLDSLQLDIGCLNKCFNMNDIVTDMFSYSTKAPIKPTCNFSVNAI